MTNITNVEKIVKKLIEKKSVTPDDDGCQEYIKNELSKNPHRTIWSKIS